MRTAVHFVVSEMSFFQRNGSNRFSLMSATCPAASTELKKGGAAEVGDEEKVGKRVIRFHYPFPLVTSMLP